MNKVGWMVVGAGVAVGALALLGAVVVDGTKNIKYASDSTGSYTLDVAIVPGKVPTGYSQTVAVRLLKDGKPLPNAQVTLKLNRASGPSTVSLVTDVMGLAEQNVTSFNAQSMTITAVYKTPGGQTVQSSATATWATSSPARY